MYRGECLCGAIKFEIHGTITSIVHCHCSQCRRAQGTAYATNGFVEKSDFNLLQGKDALSSYPLSETQTRFFCKHCGSPVMSKNTTKPDRIRIRLGTITSDIEERPIAHIFVSSRANWETIEGDLPQYDSHEPGRS